MFTLTHQYKYSLTELENMVPWERDMYVGMVNTWVKEETEKLKQKNLEAQQDLSRILRKTKRKK